MSWPPPSAPPGRDPYRPVGTSPGWNPPGYGHAPGADPLAAPPVPRPNRSPLILTAAAATTVLAIIGVVVVVLINSGGDGSSGAGRAGEVAQSYLEALARGDAQAALALSATEPPNSDLLTDDVLRKQLDALPIGGIEILGEVADPEESEDRTSVRVAVTLGDKRTESKIRMVRSDGAWKLDSSFVEVTTFATIAGSSRSTLVAFGVPVGDTGEFYAFPGPLDLTTSSPYIAVNAVAPLSFDKLGIGEILQPKFSMTDAGRKALEDTVRAHYQPCYATGPKPAQCALSTLSLSPYDPTSIRFTSPLDVGTLNYAFEGTSTSATINGTLENVSLTARASDGQAVPLTGGIILYLMVVDISKDPPVVLKAIQ